MNAVVSLFPDNDPKPTAKAERFEEFWKAYPKKVGKPLAKAKYQAIIAGGLKTRTLDKDSGTYVEIELEATEEELIEGAKRYSDRMFDRSTYRFKDDGKFICHPSTWLNRGLWMDGV